MEDFALESLRVAKLTAKQRDCLDLVVLRKSSKEIARILNISRPAVYQRLTSARRVLGAATPDEAALIYARASGAYDRISSHPPCVPPNEIIDSQEVPDERSDLSMLEEISRVYHSDTSHHMEFWPENRKDSGSQLGTIQRIAIIVVLTIGILAIVLIGLSVSQSLSVLLAS